MDQEQIYELIRKIREERKISKTATTQKEARGKKKTNNLAQKLLAMDPEERARIIAALKGEQEDE